jgi:hypothetical protein
MEFLHNTIFVCKTLIAVPLIALGAAFVGLGGLILSLADLVISEKH